MSEHSSPLRDSEAASPPARLSLLNDWPGQSGFCGARIHPECLRIGADGSVRVALSVPAAKWFETLAELGEALHLGLNSLAILGEAGTARAMTDWRNPVLPRDRDGLFTPNLGEYARLWAVREITPAGVVYALESADVSGGVFHRVIPGSAARRDLFERFVFEHQISPDQAGSWHSPNHAWSAHRRASISGRVPWLRARLAEGARDVKALSPSFIPQLLAAAQSAGLAVRTTLYHRALIQSAVWAPLRSAPGAASAGSPCFFQGSSASLRLTLSSGSSVWLWMGRCACCDEERWTVEAGDDADDIALALVSGREETETEWRSLLLQCLP